MKLKFNKDLPYIILFVLCVVIPTFNNYELTFFTWFFAMVITLRKVYSYAILKYVALSSVILLTAFVSTFFFEYKLYNIIRDITYLLKPILGLLIGYQLCRNIKNINPFRIIVYAGLVLAIIHLVTLFICIFFIKIKTMHDLRYYAGYFSDFEVYAVIILLFASKFDLQISKEKRNILLLIIGFSSFIYLARTNFIQFACLSVAMLGYLRITKKSIIIVTSFLTISALMYSAVYYSNPRRSASGFEAFLYKVKIAPFEPFKTKINEDDWKDFNDNYRSFENIITVEQVSNEGIWAILFGKGLGSTIDLGREMWTNDNEYIRYVPALHNSYMTIFLKSGLLGVVLMIVFIAIMLKNKKHEDTMITSINYLLVGTAVFLILSNWVFMGLYFKVDNKSILIGYLICYREILRKEYILNK